MSTGPTRAITPADLYRTVGLAAGLALAALIAQALSTLLLGVVLALILSLPLAAAADAAERRGLSRLAGASAAVLVLGAALTGLGFALVPEFVRQLTQFADRLPSILTGVQHRLVNIKGIHVGNLSAQLSSFVHGYTQHPQRLIGPLGQASGTAAVVLAGLVVIAVVAFALAVNPDPVLAAALRALPPAQRGPAREVLARVRAAWLGWMKSVLIDMLVLGGLLWAGMALVGLPFAVGFAVFSALMTVIPNYGSIISAIPPVLAGLSQSPGEGLLVLLVYVIVNQIEGNLLLPLIMARTVDMHPAVVAIGVLVVAALFGIIGIFVAIPLISLATILVQALWIEPQEAAAGLSVPGAGEAGMGSPPAG